MILVFIFLLGLTLLAIGYFRFKTKRLILDTKRSKIKSAAQGLCEFQGTVEKYQKSYKNLKGNDCVLYSHRVVLKEKYSKRLKLKRSTLLGNQIYEDFLIRDSTGCAEVDFNPVNESRQKKSSKNSLAFHLENIFFLFFPDGKKTYSFLKQNFPGIYEKIVGKKRIKLQAEKTPWNKVPVDLQEKIAGKLSKKIRLKKKLLEHLCIEEYFLEVGTPIYARGFFHTSTDKDVKEQSIFGTLSPSTRHDLIISTQLEEKVTERFDFIGMFSGLVGLSIVGLLLTHLILPHGLMEYSPVDQKDALIENSLERAARSVIRKKATNENWDSHFKVLSKLPKSGEVNKFWLVANSFDIAFVDPTNMEPIFSINTNERAKVNSSLFHQNGKIFLSERDTGRIELWNMLIKEPIYSSMLDRGARYMSLVGGESSEAAVIKRINLTKDIFLVRNLENHEIVYRKELTPEVNFKLVYDLQGLHAVVFGLTKTGENGEAYFWNGNLRSFTQIDLGGISRLYGSKFSPDSSRFAIGGVGKVIIFDVLDSGQLESTVIQGKNDTSYAPLAFIEGNDYITLIEQAHAVVVANLIKKEISKESIKSSSFVVSDNSRNRINNTKHYKSLGSIFEHINISPNGKWMTSFSSGANVINFWKLGKSINEIERIDLCDRRGTALMGKETECPHGDADLRVSPNGMKVISSDTLWDIKSNSRSKFINIYKESSKWLDVLPEKPSIKACRIHRKPCARKGLSLHLEKEYILAQPWLEASCMSGDSNSCGMLTSSDDKYVLSNEEYLKYAKISCENLSCSRYFQKSEGEDLKKTVQLVCEQMRHDCSKDIIVRRLNNPEYKEKAKFIYKVSCDLSHRSACQNLAELYFKEDSIKEAAIYFDKTCMLGRSKKCLEFMLNQYEYFLVGIDKLKAAEKTMSEEVRETKGEIFSDMFGSFKGVPYYESGEITGLRIVEVEKVGKVSLEIGDILLSQGGKRSNFCQENDGRTCTYKGMRSLFHGRNWNKVDWEKHSLELYKNKNKSIIKIIFTKT